jgi:crotonobetainyl-CoA:carnitine CoA-transferase CaiB-like acyl-CoA transferase
MARATPSPGERSQPLDGVRVVDLTRLLPGGYCTLVLADLGADVIKVEDPRGGDLMRTLPPHVGGLSVYHHALNRNKRSVTLDLRAKEAGEVLDRLLERADVLIENFKPRTARRLRVSAEDLRPRHSRLVHCSLTGFGQSGPYAERAAHDLNFVALAGLFEVNQDTPPRPTLGEVEGLPRQRPGQPASVGAQLARPEPHAAPDNRGAGLRPPDSRGAGLRAPDSRGAGLQSCETLHVPRLLVADIGSAWAAVAGILAALFQRERTGRGSAVDIAIHDVAASWLTFPAAAAIVRGTPNGSERPPITGEAACYNIYATADGRHIALAAIEQKFWQAFCERIGRPDFVSIQFAHAEQARLREEIAAVFRSRTLADWLAMFADVDACLAPINTIDEALADRHLTFRGAVVSHGRSKFVRSPVVFGDCSTQVLRHDRPAIVPARPLGADTDDVLRSVGLDDSDLAGLRCRGII